MHFDKPGRDNTDSTLEQAYKRAQELGINEVVVASSKGYTAKKTLEVFSRLQGRRYYLSLRV